MAALTGIVVRAWLLAGPLGTLDSDEAVSGLIALRMLEGDISALYWLGNYGGTLESALAAVVFATFGSSVLALKLTTLALFFVAGVLTWRVGLRTVGPRSALVGAGLLWIAPAYFVWWSTKARGFYATGLVLGLLAFLLALRLHDRASRRDAGLLGLALGLGWWTTPGILILAAPALGWLGWRRPRILRLAPFALPGFVIGVAPWVAWNVRNDWLSLRLSPVAAQESSLVERVVDLFHYVLPTWLGLRIPFSLDWFPATFVGWVAFGAALAGFCVLLAQRHPGLEPLLITATMFPVAYGLSKFTYYVDEPRYVVYLAPVLALLAASRIVTLTRAGIVLSAALALSIAGLVKMEQQGLHRPLAPDVRIPRDVGPAIDVLEHHGADRVLANYWLAYPITFESEERIIASPTGFWRYRPYRDAVAAAESPARVFVEGSVYERRERQRLLGRGYRRIAADGFIVYVVPR